MSDILLDALKTLEMHGSICISSADWEAVKAKIEDEFVRDGCDGVHLTLRLNKHGNLSVECGGAPTTESVDSHLIITHDEARGHRIQCQVRPPEVSEEKVD